MKKDKTKRPFISAKDIIIGGIVVIFTALAFGKPVPFFNPNFYTPTRSVLKQEITDFVEHDIKALPASEIIAKTELKDGKKTLMVIYASWCGYCKTLIPNIISLKEEGKLENTNLIFISTDKDKTELAKYLLEHDYNKYFIPYIIEKEAPDALENMIMSKGHYYSGGVPYTIIFDDEGKILSTIIGTIEKDKLLAKIQ